MPIERKYESCKAVILFPLPNGESIIRPHGDDAIGLVPLEEINAFHVVPEACGDALANGFVEVDDIMEHAFAGDIHNHRDLMRGGRTRRILDLHIIFRFGT